MARAFADTATIGLLNARTLQQAETLNQHLHTALHSRITIEQAKGHLVGQHHLFLDDAFEMMRRHARRHHLLLTTVTEHITTTATLLTPSNAPAPPTARPAALRQTRPPLNARRRRQRQPPLPRGRRASRTAPVHPDDGRDDNANRLCAPSPLPGLYDETGTFPRPGPHFGSSPEACSSTPPRTAAGHGRRRPRRGGGGAASMAPGPGETTSHAMNPPIGATASKTA
ncbi:ANTAR domain-containing protein [Streptomyces chrestomyceticus]|uniref:ANTAR domain-containing protein n=1 Tax=Streptomyces chrestomyceticus TaxID=68185 RepID=UPI0033FDE2F2